MELFLHFMELKVLYLLLLLRLSLSQNGLCSNSANGCILPQPEGSPGGRNLNSILLETRCSLGCIDEYGRRKVELIDEQTSWPTVDFISFQSTCSVSHQKMRECKEGCMQRNSDPFTTINRCRDNCHSSCRQAQICSGGSSCAGLTCPRSCRKTYCRFGCEIHDSTIEGTGGSSIQYPPVPLQAPSVIPITSPPGIGKSWLYTVDSRASILSQNTSSAAYDYSATAYIVNVSTSDQSYYYWQKNASIPLDFTYFACSTISVSFTVVSKYSIMADERVQFSPSTTVCVPGVGGYPSKVDQGTMRVDYTEDLRDGFFGYSIANLSWSSPENSQYLTSYTIRIYPDNERCGGSTGTSHHYSAIDKDLTSFIFQARSNNGLWKFGCSYLIEIVSLPTSRPISETIGTHITSAADLRNANPTFNLKCSRIWDEDGYFNISVTWSFQDSFPTSHLMNYTIRTTLQVDGNGAIFQRFNAFNYTPENDHQKHFKFITEKFLPHVNPDLRYALEISAKVNSLYYWRRVPQTQYCKVPASPMLPTPISIITITSVNYNRSNESLDLSIKLTPPEKPFGFVTHYEVVLHTSLVECFDCISSDGQRFLSEISEMDIHTFLEVNNSSDHCVFLSARVMNNFNLSSNWSSPLVVPLDEKCEAYTGSSSNGSVLSIFYQREGEERAKVFEIGCEGSLFTSSESIEDKLQTIDEKIENLSLRIQGRVEVDDRESQMETKLRSIENKLDSVLEAIESQAHQGT